MSASAVHNRSALAAVLALLTISTGCSALTDRHIDRVSYRTSNAAANQNAAVLRAFQPSNDRDWAPDQAVLAVANFQGDQVTVRNIRNINYRTIDDYDVRYYDKTFDLKKVTSVDFIVVPFNDTPGIAHTMLSFGFEDRDYLGVSVEIRKERGEKYSPVAGFFRQYELMYVLADERDLILKDSMQWLCDVYIYRTRATPAQARQLLVDVLNRTNKLAAQPEFYNTLTNNCTTNIRDHINDCFPDRVPYDYRVLLPGYSAEFAYDLGLLDTRDSFAVTQQRSRVNYAAYLHRDDPQFSVAIRKELAAAAQAASFPGNIAR